jgi:beta-lactamase class A
MTTTTVTQDLERIFEDAGAKGFLHARAIGGDGEVALDAGELVVTASVFKVPVLLETARQVATGERSWTDRIRVTPGQHTLGPTGLSVMVDEVDVSLRDLAYLMMSVSDNTATDVIMAIVGLDRINGALRELGLEQTTLVGDCKELLGSFSQDTGIDRSGDFASIDPEELRKWRSLDPARTSRTTPAEMTKLLKLIWLDEAASAEACAEIRRIMALQVWPHRLTSGFPSGVTLAAKTGTLPGIRNEAGVVTYPDGSRYAVAVFTRAHTYVDRQPLVDASIGKSAFAAVESLRS